MCGIIAIWNKDQNKTLLLLIEYLKKLQHRGQDSFGYSFSKETETELETKRISGLARNYLLPQTEIKPSHLALGHLRYSTSGPKTPESSQPLYSNIGEFVLVHNGNLPNKKNLTRIIKESRMEVGADHTLFLSSSQDGWDTNLSDSQMMVKYIELQYLINIQNKVDQQDEDNLWERIFRKMLNQIPGVYCLAILTKNSLWILRDFTGIKPLIIAKRKNGNEIVIASESIIIDPEHQDKMEIIDFTAGQIMRINSDGGIKQWQGRKPDLTPCLFEYVYFLDPGSTVNGINVLEFRQKTGYYLAQSESKKYIKHFQKAKDLIHVIGAPSTGLPSAKSYAEALGLKYSPSILTKKSARERTFILKNNQARQNAVRDKYNYDGDKIKDNIIIIVDDSLVRGNTITIINNRLWELGAKEIHVRISSPPVRFPSYYGIDIPTKEELIANDPKFQNIENRAKMINANSLEYLSFEDTDRAIEPLEKGKYIRSCFDGVYRQDLFDW